MNDILTKYNTLSPDSQQEVNDFLDFMLSKYEEKKVFDMNSWKAKIKDVPTWTRQDIKKMEENGQEFDQWKSEEW